MLNSNPKSDLRYLLVWTQYAQLLFFNLSSIFRRITKCQSERESNHLIMDAYIGNDLVEKGVFFTEMQVCYRYGSLKGRNAHLRYLAL